MEFFQGVIPWTPPDVGAMLLFDLLLSLCPPCLRPRLIGVPGYDLDTDVDVPDLGVPLQDASENDHPLDPVESC